MLRDYAAIATVAVRDLAAAERFYATVLGLAKHPGGSAEAVSYDAGSSALLVYRSAVAGTNKATAVNWSVGNEFDKIVDDIRSRGVSFEHYDMPGVERNGDIHSAMGMRMVWFKDPDGNVHSIMDTPARS